MSSEQPLTGTRDRPIEEIPTDASSAVDWLVLLGGPAIWISHFMVVYLAAEAACVPTSADQYDVFGEGPLVLITAAATVVAAAGCGGVAWIARRRIHRQGGGGPASYAIDIASAGFLLAIGALIGVLAVAVPVAYLSPLC